MIGINSFGNGAGEIAPLAVGHREGAEPSMEGDGAALQTPPVPKKWKGLGISAIQRSEPGFRLPGGALVRATSPNDSHGVQKLAVTRQEAAEMLSICSKTLDRLVSDGAIRSIKVGRRRIFPVEGILVWLQENASSHLPPHSPAAVDTSLPLTVDRQEAARLLSMGTRLLDEVVASGQLPRIQYARKLVFRTCDLVRWLRRLPGNSISI